MNTPQPADSSAPPRNPRDFPVTVPEQLAYLVVPELEFQRMPAADALAYLEQLAVELGDAKRGGPMLGAFIRVVKLVPLEVLERSRLTLKIPSQALGAAFRHVAEAVGLFTRLHEDTLLVCSWEVAAALDGNVRQGFQSELWETESPDYQAIVYQPRPADWDAIQAMFGDTPSEWAANSLRFSSHYFVAGTPDNALEIAEGLFRQRPFKVPIQEAEGPQIPGIEPEVWG